MNCVILQPSYIPWRGYFHQIQKADVFVFYDCVQYDEHGWRNRNRIKTDNGLQWLTIPVVTKGVHSNHVLIKDIQTVPNNPWKAKHWRALRQNYGKAPFFEHYASLLERFYVRQDIFLADFICELTIALAGELGLHNTRFIRSSTLGVTGAKTDRLLNVLAKVGAKHYISGPSARDYLETGKFAAAGITLEFMTYDYPAYPQLHPPFDPQVSVLDLLFMTGPDAPRFIWNRATGG